MGPGWPGGCRSRAVIVGFTASIAIAKSFAAEHEYSVDANQEMLAYGAANLGAGALRRARTPEFWTALGALPG